jgi:hypothetical protein
VHNGLIYLPGMDETVYEDSDMGPEFRQRRQYVLPFFGLVTYFERGGLEGFTIPTFLLLNFI